MIYQFITKQHVFLSKREDLYAADYWTNQDNQCFVYSRKLDRNILDQVHNVMKTLHLQIKM